MISRKTFKQKNFPRNSCSKDFGKFRKNFSGGVYLQKSWRTLQLYKGQTPPLIDHEISRYFSNILDILGTKHTIYQKKGNLMSILKIDGNRHLPAMQSGNSHLFADTIFQHVTKYLNKVFCGFQTGRKIKCFNT